MQTYLKTKPVWMQLLLFLGLAFGIFIVVSLIGTSILASITGMQFTELADSEKLESNPQRLTLLRGMLLIQFLGLFALPSLLFAYFSDPYPAQYLGLKQPSKTGFWLVAVALLFIAIPAVEFTGILNKKLLTGNELKAWAQGMEDEAQKTIRLMLSTTRLSDLLLNLIFIAGFAAAGEELFFRGILQRLFIKGTKNPWIGIVIAAFLFSFLHFQFFGFIPRFLLGILLGAVYWYSGSLYAAIAAHFIYDAFIIVFVYFNPQMLQNPEAPMMNESYLGIAAAVSAALVGGLVWWMKKASTTNYGQVYAADDDNTIEKDFTF